MSNDQLRHLEMLLVRAATAAPSSRTGARYLPPRPANAREALEENERERERQEVERRMRWIASGGY